MMGNGSSLTDPHSKLIYFSINGSVHKIRITHYTPTSEVKTLLCQLAKCSISSELIITDDAGAFLSASGSIPSNDAAHPYRVKISQSDGEQPSGTEILVGVLQQVNQQFARAFDVQESRRELLARLKTLEEKLQSDNLKMAEIDKCKRDISQIRDNLDERQRNKTESSLCINKIVYEDDLPVIAQVRSVPNFTKYVLSQETVEYLKQPTFDIWHWEPNEMLHLLEHMYYELGLVQEFNINPMTLKKWLLCIQANYRKNPFHNFRHCFCVAQMMYGLVNQCSLTDKLTREEIGVLITAAICHDLDHPGYNNAYQVNARTDLAIRYNDISPLENHHCAVAFQILAQPECNIFINVTTERFKRIRSEIIAMILATDMARHGDIMETFKGLLNRFDWTNEQHVIVLKEVLIKCCDISNEARPFDVSAPWLDCLLEEYFNQSDREKEEGLPVAPFMDREKVTKPSAQIGFIRFVLLPMFEALNTMFNQVDNLVATLRHALDKYEKMEEEEELRRRLRIEQSKLVEQFSVESQGRGVSEVGNDA